MPPTPSPGRRCSGHATTATVRMRAGWHGIESVWLEPWLDTLSLASQMQLRRMHFLSKNLKAASKYAPLPPHCRLLCPLLAASAAAAAERLLGEGASPWNRDCNQRLPLHFAAEAGACGGHLGSACVASQAVPGEFGSQTCLDQHHNGMCPQGPAPLTWICHYETPPRRPHRMRAAPGAAHAVQPGPSSCCPLACLPGCGRSEWPDAGAAGQRAWAPRVRGAAAGCRWHGCVGASAGAWRFVGRRLDG